MSAPAKNPILYIFLLVFQIGICFTVTSQVIHVGPGYPYGTLAEAAVVAVPGDTILVHQAIYPGGLFIGNLQGTATDWIHLLAAPGETVIFEGGSNAWQFTDAAFLEISGFIFQHQTGNGLNFDDGGSYETPAHHIIFDHCTFRDMNASGNNDMLKLSGVDSFEVRHCTFLNGSAGGSGIDMVGCHDSSIHGNHFENQGSNSIQAKGGTQNIRIERNFFKNGGARAVNLGGSTGLQFFRPLDAPFEAADLKVYSNVFIGSDAPIAYVGTIYTEVINNTIYLPTKWVLRILQETVDTSRFPPCGYNTFRNNIIYINNLVNVACNIGPNTAPETFTFSNNLWYHSENNNWSGPDLPVTDENNLVGEDPLFTDASFEDFTLSGGSPAIGAGYEVNDPEIDFQEDNYISPRSIGAFEGGEMTGTIILPIEKQKLFYVFPNPTPGIVNIEFPVHVNECYISVSSIHGTEVIPKTYVPAAIGPIFSFPMPQSAGGIFVITVEGKGMKQSQLIVVD